MYIIPQALQGSLGKEGVPETVLSGSQGLRARASCVDGPGLQRVVWVLRENRELGGKNHSPSSPEFSPLNFLQKRLLDTY